MRWGNHIPFNLFRGNKLLRNVRRNRGMVMACIVSFRLVKDQTGDKLIRIA